MTEETSKHFSLEGHRSKNKPSAYIPLDITNGGFQSSIDEYSSGMNLTATTALSPITRIISPTSRTTNYEIHGDDTNGGNGLTQPTIVSEPYFDAQTPRNVTGLVGEGGNRYSG